MIEWFIIIAFLYIALGLMIAFVGGDDGPIETGYDLLGFILFWPLAVALFIVRVIILSVYHGFIVLYRIVKGE